MDPATLKIYLGPMFSGKTTRLIKNLTKLADTGLRVLFIGNAKDTRIEGDDVVSTHNSGYIQLSPKIKGRITVNKLEGVDVNNFDAIGIDEGQFVPDLVPMVILWLSQGKSIRCAALDGDYLKRPFGDTLKLIPHCDKVVKLSAKCHLCLEETNNGVVKRIKAPFTLRLKGGDAQTVVGGRDKYMAVCRKHHNSVE